MSSLYLHEGSEPTTAVDINWWECIWNTKHTKSFLPYLRHIYTPKLRGSKFDRWTVTALMKCSSDDKPLYLTLTGEGTRDGTFCSHQSSTVFLSNHNLFVKKQTKVLENRCISSWRPPFTFWFSEPVTWSLCCKSSCDVQSHKYFFPLPCELGLLRRTRLTPTQHCSSQLLYKEEELLAGWISLWAVSISKTQYQIPARLRIVGGRELIIPDFIVTLPTNVKRTAFWQEKNACMWRMIKSCSSSD